MDEVPAIRFKLKVPVAAVGAAPTQPVAETVVFRLGAAGSSPAPQAPRVKIKARAPPAAAPPAPAARAPPAPVTPAPRVGSAIPALLSPTSGPDQPGKKTRPLEEVLSKLIADISRKDEYGFFGQPVPLQEVPDYLDVIRKPMDLGTMGNKVRSGAYFSLDEFIEDFVLVCENAKKYNKPDTIFYKGADKLHVAGVRIINSMISRTNIEPPKKRRRRAAAQSLAMMDQDRDRRVSFADPADDVGDGSGLQGDDASGVGGDDVLTSPGSRLRVRLRAVPSPGATPTAASPAASAGAPTAATGIRIPVPVAAVQRSAPKHAMFSPLRYKVSSKWQFEDPPELPPEEDPQAPAFIRRRGPPDHQLFGALKDALRQVPDTDDAEAAPAAGVRGLADYLLAWDTDSSSGSDAGVAPMDTSEDAAAVDDSKTNGASTANDVDTALGLQELGIDMSFLRPYASDPDTVVAPAGAAPADPFEAIKRVSAASAETRQELARDMLVLITGAAPEPESTRDPWQTVLDHLGLLLYNLQVLQYARSTLKPTAEELNLASHVGRILAKIAAKVGPHPICGVVNGAIRTLTENVSL